jgi:hypothetical protein
VLVEHEQDGFPFDVLEADVDGVGQAGGAAAVDHRVGDGGEDAVLQHVAQFGFAVDVARCCWASSAALPRATMPGTLWVPARRPRSWWPPSRKGRKRKPLRT